MNPPIRHPESKIRRASALMVLVVAGESIFFLPFLLPRVFRPTLLDVFGLTNLDLGLAFAAYGFVAMISYALGGPLADRFHPRILLSTALATTAGGGLVLASQPSLPMLKGLYAYWGVTTIALFWAALIRATREWGGVDGQGVAFGLLDGGRGLLAAAMGTIIVWVYSWLLPVEVESATLAHRTRAFHWIILLMGAIPLGAAVLALFALSGNRSGKPARRPRLRLSVIMRALGQRTVWLQALIILCAYVGFKVTDDFSLYAHEVIGLNEVQAAGVGALSLWVRPVAAIGAGYIADRVGIGVMTAASFGMLLLGSGALASGVVMPGMIGMFYFTVVGASLGIYALRGLYYAIMREGGVPLAVTGSAVGLVSVIGYTPDVFMGPLMGYLLDQSPGQLGHQHVFAVVSGFALIGLAASILFVAIVRKRNAVSAGMTASSAA